MSCSESVIIVLHVYTGSGFQRIQSYTCLFKPTPSSLSFPASFTSPSSSSYLFLFRPLGVVLSERWPWAFNTLSDFSPRALPAKSEKNRHKCKLQALVYNILPSTTAVFSYATVSRKVSDNEQFFVGAQTVVRLLQTTQIQRGVPL